MSVRAIQSSVVLVILIAASSSSAADESTTVGIDPDGVQKVGESFAHILGQSHHVLSFARFTLQYGKIYQNEEEIKHRFSVFKENLDLIESTNKKGLSYKLGVNQFADLTFQEFQRNQKGGAAQNKFATLKGSHSLTQVAAPETRDWRVHKCVSRVKIQGQCDSSWAFSAIGAVESAYCLKHNRYLPLFSEQNLIDCSTPYGNRGCGGGSPSNAFGYIKDNGVTSEQLSPYTGRVQRCNNSVRRVALVIHYVNITSGDEDKLKRAVGIAGPVSISFHVVSSLQFYKSGVYSSSDCGNTLEGVNHYALAVGYGIENGVPYWLIKNSWGEDWGERGYFKVEMGKNMCGVATSATYPFVA